jgi:hypothetical protein
MFNNTNINNNNNNNNNPHLTLFPVMIRVSITPVGLPATQEIKNGVTQIYSYSKKKSWRIMNPFTSVAFG